PAGLTLNTTTGAIAGTPTVAGSYAFTVKVTDVADSTNSASASYTVAIGAAQVKVVTTALPAGRERVTYSASEQAAGGSGIVTWSVVSGTLPAGLTLSASTGVLSGTPT